MATEEMGDLLNQIGQQVANILGKVPDDVFVFIEAAEQMSGGAIFENLPEQIVYHEFGHETHDTISELWEAAAPDKKWSMLLYDIKDGSFDAEFLYTDDLDGEWYPLDYRQDALRARYGDKPVIYPPMDDGDWHELTEDDLPDDVKPDPA
jgi:hypothetical protein